MSDSKAIAIIPRTLAEVTDLSARFAKSALIPQDLRNKEADVFVTLLAGQELGLSPMASLRSIYVVKGKPVLSADAMVGLVLASGLCDYFRAVAKTPASVTYETKRKGQEPCKLEWTLEYARNAGLVGGDNWKKYPRAMLSARCKAELARDVYPDVLAGVYETSEADEIRGDARPEATVTPLRQVEAIDAEIVSETRIVTPPAFDVAAVVASFEAAADADALRMLAAEASKRVASEAPEVRSKVKNAYLACKDALSAIAAKRVAEVQPTDAQAQPADDLDIEDQLAAGAE